MILPIRRALFLAILTICLFASQAGSAQAAGLSVTPITWDVIGVKSNNTGLTTGPYQFPVGVKVCNTSGGSLSNVATSYTWDSSNAYVSLETASTDSIGTLADGACADSYYTVGVSRVSAARGTTRKYHIDATANGGASGSSPTGRQLYVESLVSQNRNTTYKISGPGGCNADYSVCDPAPNNLTVGQTYTYKLYAKTSTGYEQLESFITFPGSIFRVESASSSYEIPGVTSSGLYANACGWNPTPTSGTYRSCVGPAPAPFSPGGKAGGKIVITYQVTVTAAGSGSLTSLIYDYSGSSYHYNSDYGGGGFSVNITATQKYPLDVTVTGSGNVASNTGGIDCGQTGAVCDAEYTSGASVTLTATPGSGQNFDPESSDCPGSFWAETPPTSGVYTCVTTMDAAKSATAIFTGPSYVPLTAEVTGQGKLTSDDSNIACGVGTGDVCDHSYLLDTESPASVVLGADPEDGYKLNTSSSTCPGTGWTDTGGGNYTCTVTMDQARDATALFEPAPQYTLDVTVGGSGQVTSDIGDISCGYQDGACSKDYGAGDEVKLTATPAPGQTFNTGSSTCPGSGWTEDPPSSGDYTCTVTMDAAKSATANFSGPNYFPLDVTVTSGQGSVSSAPAGITCTASGGVGCDASYITGMTTTLTASPSPGYRYTSTGSSCPGSGWTAAGSGVYTCDVVMDDAKSATIGFEAIPKYTLDATVTGTGTVQFTPAGTICTDGDDCSEDYDEGTSVTLTATPATGKTLDTSNSTCPGSGWSAGDGGIFTCVVAMTEARSATAVFISNWTLTVQISGPGTVTSSDEGGVNCISTTIANCTHDYADGTVVTLTATPDSGNVMGMIHGCNGNAWTDAGNGTWTCQITMNQNQTAMALYVPGGFTYYPLTTTVNGNGTVAYSPVGSTCIAPGSLSNSLCKEFVSGTSVTITATPDPGQNFVPGSSVCPGTGWTATSGGAYTCVTTMSAAKEAEATFEVTLTGRIVGKGKITNVDQGGIDCRKTGGINCVHNYPAGTKVNLLATPAFGWHFVKWSLCTYGGSSCSPTLNDNLTITATFAANTATRVTPKRRVVPAGTKQIVANARFNGSGYARATLALCVHGKCSKLVARPQRKKITGTTASFIFNTKGLRCGRYQIAVQMGGKTSKTALLVPCVPKVTG